MSCSCVACYQGFPALCQYQKLSPSFAYDISREYKIENNQLWKPKMENKGLSAEQVEELMEWLGNQIGLTGFCSPILVQKKIYELQTPVKRYVEVDLIRNWIEEITSELNSSPTLALLSGWHNRLCSKAKTLEELKDA